MALSPLFSPTHRHWTGEQIEVICESVLMMDGHNLGIAVTYRLQSAGSFWTTPKSHFDGYEPDPDDDCGMLRRFTPIVG